ncbi:MAG: riboflavin synthase subunit beta [Winogradskyella sp.]|uniref:riboflavin synthase subunit beta n=1 Tax=Winogradskyella sp. TaxID=1883156 RepID=UPI0017D4202C|nr:riboflavin synthase subunit beta [Winogradskyella sp.]
MGLMKLKKNKKFNYKPRFYKGEGNPYELKHKFDAHRKTINPPKGIKGKFNAALEDYKNRDANVNRRLFIIIGVLVLLFLIIIDFDLSIFFSNS